MKQEFTSKPFSGYLAVLMAFLFIGGDKRIVELDEDKKAAMVSNLMVVLCGDRDVNPVVNTGTLHT